MTQRSAYAHAVDLLSRREHSQAELFAKLKTAGHAEEDIASAVEKLRLSGLQSDQRFSENYVRYRCQRGIGTIKINQELKTRGIARELINDYLYQVDIDWFALALKARCKRFGEQSPADVKDRAKQQRFLQYRGFTHEQITKSFEVN